MNSSSSSNRGGDQTPGDDYCHAVWFCVGGAGLGLCAALLAGPWLANTAVGGVVGYLIGALIDRSRR